MGQHHYHGQTSSVTSSHASDPSTYGRSFADVYDHWYANSFDTDGAVDSLRGLAATGPVLELGVGTGRLALPLAKTGLRVVGLDASPEMLSKLQVADSNSSVIPVLGDMADIENSLSDAEIADSFSLIICAFNTLLNLGGFDALTQCLRGSRERLLPHGRVVIEAFVPIDQSAIPAISLTPARVASDAAVFIETTFNAMTSQLHGRHIEVHPGSVVVRPWSVLICGTNELDSAAKTAGLVLTERFSDWIGSPFTDESAAHVSIYAPTE